MSPEQFKQLLETVQAGNASGFNWVQGALALAATLVSVTGVVVGMRSAISSLARQLDTQCQAVEHLREEIGGMSRQLAVINYAMGIETKDKNE